MNSFLASQPQIKSYMNWSGGKDSSLCLHYALQQKNTCACPTHKRKQSTQPHLHARCQKRVAAPPG